MIAQEKTIPAFAAIQQIFIKARWMIGKRHDLNEVYDLLDGAEYLAGLASETSDKTKTFEDYLEMLCNKHSCKQALTIFRE